MRENYINVGRIKQARRQARHRVIFIIVSAIVIFALSILLGQYLRAQVDAMPQRGDLPEALLSGQLPADTSDASKISIMASDLPLIDLPDANAIAELVEELTLGSREAVSLCLRDDGGNIHYRSSVAQNLVGQTADGTDLSILLPALHNANIYTSAVFGVTAFATADPVDRELLRAYELSLAAEIGTFAIDEILLTGLPITVDTLDEITAFLEEIDALLPENVQLAVSIPAELTQQPAGAVLIKQISLIADTVALDLRTLTAEDSQSLADAASTIFSEASLYFSKYNMRVLIPHVDNETFSAFRQSMELNGIHNWQVAR